jgi:molybdopterin-guanine dinucleotide biosynthesis protein A
MTIKVGIISKKAHAKSHVKAMLAQGYDPVLLGGLPSINVPQSLDALVVRPASCSHQGSELGAKIAKSRDIPVIFENSVTRIMAALNDHFNPLQQLADVQEEAMSAPNNCREAMQQAIEAGGLFFPRLMDQSVTQIVDVLQGVGLVRGQKARKRALDAFENVNTYNDRTRGGAFSRLLKENVDDDGFVTEGCNYAEHAFWWLSTKNQTGVMPILAKVALTDEQLETLAGMTGYHTTSPKGAKKMKSPRQQVDSTPIKGEHHRAYYNRRQERWSVRIGSTKHVASAYTREEAANKVLELDLKYVEATEAADQQVEALVANLEEVKAAESVVVEVQAPVVPQPEVEPMSDEEIIRTHLRVLHGHMERMGIRIFEAEGMSVEVLTVHLSTPEGSACNHKHVDSSGHQTKHIGKVTCKLCKSTQLYKHIELALLGDYTIGD